MNELENAFILIRKSFRDESCYSEPGEDTFRSENDFGKVSGSFLQLAQRTGILAGISTQFSDENDSTAPPDKVHPVLLAYAKAARSRAQTAQLALKKVVATVSPQMPPVVLKGAAFIAEAGLTAQPWRPMADIDLLLPADDARPAWQALKRNGFVEDGSPYSPRLNPHLPLLTQPGSGIGVEIHTRCRLIQTDRLLEPEAMRAAARRIETECGPLLIPTDEDRLIHLVIHGQVESHRFERRSVHLRDAIDFLLLAIRDGVSLDRIAGRFDEAGLGHAFTSFVRLMERVWGRTFLAGNTDAQDLRWVGEVIAGLDDPRTLAPFLARDRLRLGAAFIIDPRRWPLLAAFASSPAHWRELLIRRSYQDNAVGTDRRG